MDESQKIIYDLLTEVREDQKKDSKRIQKTESCVDNMQDELSEVREETKINTKHMGEHISRTEIAEKGLDILKELHSDNQKRIELIESENKKKDIAIVELQVNSKVSEKAKSTIRKNIIYWLTIIGLTVGLVTKMKGLW